MKCNKVPYTSYREAQTQLHRIGKKFWRDGSVVGRINPSGDKKPKRSYQCEICGQWHLTSISEKNKHRKRK